MVSVRKKKQQNKKFFSQLDKSATDFMIGQSNHEAQVASKTNVVDIAPSSNNLNDLIQVNSP